MMPMNMRDEHPQKGGLMIGVKFGDASDKMRSKLEAGDDGNGLKSKGEVRYQESNGAAGRCGACEHFLGEMGESHAECELVAGGVDEFMVCDLFEPKAQEEEPPAEEKAEPGPPPAEDRGKIPPQFAKGGAA